MPAAGASQSQVRASAWILGGVVSGCWTDRKRVSGHGTDVA